MRGWPAKAAASVLALAVLLAAGCSNPLGRQYEYEEQMYLGVDGSATVVITASVPALVALRNLKLDPSALARVNRDDVRALFAGEACGDVRVGVPWIRRGRHFVDVQITTKDVNHLSDCAPLAWSSYHLHLEEGLLHYVQTVGAPGGGNPGAVNWDGSELVAFRLHVPSRIVFHNVKRLSDGANGAPVRGNILTWEQRLADRRAGVPLTLDVKMDPESILYRTIWLFVGAFLAAVLTLALVIWTIMRRARKRPLGSAAVSSRRPA